METAIWQNFNNDGVLFVGISNTNNQNVISNFIAENSLTFPILYDSGSSGGVQGGDTYDDYYMPNDGSPYPRDFIINQNGIIAYGNNEIDTEWMIYVINELLGNNSILLGDINQDGIINVLDIILTVNIVLGVTDPADSADLNQDGSINILDIVSLVNIILSF
tara:strand:+ start:272 stop:760 length:489 start_codon:yes stop_codon:yes gene_type:complete